LNYCKFLQQNSFFEEAFRVYERALEVFPWPHCYELWLAYLRHLTERYGEEKLERIRDLFEQVLVKAPLERRRPFFLMYANFEEQFGLLRHAM